MPGILTPSRKHLYSPEYMECVLATDPIIYCVLDEKQGTIAWDQVTLRRLTARHGAHAGVTLYQPGIGDGRTSPFYDSLNDFTNIYTVSFRDAFALYNDPTGLLDESEGTAMIWGKMANAGVWTDGAERFMFILRVDGNNRIWIQKDNANNAMEYWYKAGGVSETLAVPGLTTTDWMCLGITWSKSANIVSYYYNGLPVGTDGTLGVWAGNLGATVTVIGAKSTVPATVWHGYLNHFVAYGRALTPAMMWNLYRWRDEAEGGS